jgi:hypothetical protein
MRMVAAVVGVVLAAGAACGGNGGGDDTAAGRAIEPEAQDRAEAIVLKLSDFPNGWRASAPEDEEGGEEFRKCIGVDYSRLTMIGEAESQDFAMGESTEASSEVSIFKSDQQAEGGIREFSEGMRSETVEDCVRDLVEQAFRGERSLEVGEIDVGELSFTPPDVDEAEAWQIVIPVEITSGVAEGLSPDVYLEFMTMREGDTVADVRTSDVLTEFDPDLRGKLVQAVAERMSE